MIKRLLVSASIFALVGVNAHAQVTKVLRDGNGATFNALGHVDGSGNFQSDTTICDPATPSSCATVTSGAISVTSPGGATAANQTATQGSATGGTAASASQLLGCVYNASALTPSSGQQVAAQCDPHGYFNVDIANVTGILAGSSTLGNTGALIMGTVLTTPQSYGNGTNQFVGMNTNGDLRADQMVVSSGSGVATVAQAHICGNHVTVNPSTATNTQLVAPVPGKIVYICDYNFSTNGANNFFLESVTGASCAGAAAMDTVWYMAANGAKTDANAYYRGLATASGSGVCLNTSAAAATSFSLFYDQY